MANLVVAGDDVVWASWHFVAEEEIPSLRNKNEDIGAYVTAGARLYLYSFLDRLQERAIYSDTDSVLYVQPREGPALVETRDNLGAMTLEFKPSEFIEEFIRGGPKNYTYKTVHAATGERKIVCIIRGIRLNYSTSELVNFEVIKDVVLKGTKMRYVTVHTEKKIKWKSLAGGGIVSIITEPEDKMYRTSLSNADVYPKILRSRSGINRASDGAKELFHRSTIHE